MNAETAGYHFIHQGNPFEINRPLGLANHLILLIHSPVRISINHEPFTEYGENTILILDKKTPRHYMNIGGTPFINDFVQYSADRHDLSRFSLEVDHVYDEIPSHYAHSLAKIIFHIANEQREQQCHSDAIANLYLELFFYTLGQCINSAPQFDTEHPLFRTIYPIRNQIVNNFQNNINVDEEARRAGLSPFYFRRIYKEIFGKAPQADIIETRLEYSRMLLAKTDDTIRRVAEQCGYHNEEHFMRQFKQRYGISPTAYRYAKQ